MGTMNLYAIIAGFSSPHGRIPEKTDHIPDIRFRHLIRLDSQDISLRILTAVFPKGKLRDDRAPAAVYGIRELLVPMDKRVI